jgi:hypothetical protein
MKGLFYCLGLPKASDNHSCRAAVATYLSLSPGEILSGTGLLPGPWFGHIFGHPYILLCEIIQDNLIS